MRLYCHQSLICSHALPQPISVAHQSKDRKKAMSQERQAGDLTASTPVTFRRGTPDDLVATHALLLDSLSDLAWRMGIQDSGRVPTDEERAEDLQQWRPILDHLTTTGDQYWVAERGGELIGVSRSVLRDDVRELTEFFVSPHAQSDGIGRELLSRALPPGARRTYIMASLDMRAQALYLKLGVYQVCAVYTFYKELKKLEPRQDNADALTILPIGVEHLSTLAKLDLAVHGYTRDEDHLWLMNQRTGFLLLREDQAVGYAYVGTPYSGPFVMLEQQDMAPALAYAENIAFAKKFESFGIDVPMLNRSAVKYLLARGYQMSPFFCFYMCSEQPALVENTIITGPMIMV
jgi:GNAT superfamily N-acetyltransferase